MSNPMSGNPTQISAEDAAELATRVTGPVLLAGQDGYAEECAMYNPAVLLQPAVVVGATGPADIQAALAFAQRHRLDVAVMNTGHTAAVEGNRTLLITTRRMDEVTIDPATRRARVGGGARWQQVVDAAARHGLAPLTGSSPLVGVVGYLLGGGLSATMGRKHGWASDHVTALDVVTADGQARHTDAANEPELFWSLRGSKSNLGVVTAVEFDLFPVTRLYGGALIFPGDEAEAVLRAYGRLTAEAPDELTTSIAFMRLPDVPIFPEPLRGTFTVHVRISFLGEAPEANRLLAPLRAAAPIIVDTVADLPYTAFASIYSDPESPAPFAERTLSLAPLTDDSMTRLIEEIGPKADVPANIIELRHLGGALRRTPAGAGAAGLRDAEFVLWVVTVGDPDTTGPAVRWTSEFFDRLQPWAVEGKHLNFIGREDQSQEAVRAAYPAATFARLVRAKATYDLANVFRLNHNIQPLR
ncbi:FAD-binding oxidoreductase [Micromonospora sp. WMMD1120]|uniref:FAD-binding oxidoreductase n=1 Tax=Micromonospora sp. WMMD1120 TaxID=3016106 RepID=UPI0024174319|nr:FAD-binding oxidoreductase [Micromonospora sp. WMMD1120]MDG4811131.1 FAD-binding oxidoreductase [Micromonospora sp. WMMD1120]